MKHSVALLIAGMSLAGSAFAADTTPKAHYDAAKKAAATRYADDKKLCAEESSSSARMQCLRDAKAERDKALAQAKSDFAKATGISTDACADCGEVLSVKMVEQEGKGGAVGVVAGGVAGALLGHQVGKGTGQDLATIAGAAGGAYAGHKVEGKLKTVKKWKVAVRFDSGEEKTYTFDNDPGFATGTPVKASNGSVVRR